VSDDGLPNYAECSQKDEVWLEKMLPSGRN